MDHYESNPFQLKHKCLKHALSFMNSFVLSATGQVVISESESEQMGPVLYQPVKNLGAQEFTLLSFFSKWKFLVIISVPFWLLSWKSFSFQELCTESTYWFHWLEVTGVGVPSLQQSPGA